MLLYSTKDPSKRVSLKEAVFRGLPEDNGLYMPVAIPALPDDFIHDLPAYSFQEIAETVTRSMLQGAVPDEDIKKIIDQSITFPAPLVSLTRNVHILELFHGPSMAFKDFGARFMAQLMSYFREPGERELIILVATSGDTGGAVAAGFYDTPGIEVVILYPSGKVSNLQEKQLTTWGRNITALEIDGTFDDCQSMVKQAFLDKELTTTLALSSANSINIARLIPQSFYYFESFKQLEDPDIPVVYSVPSGNFGNLTAGLLAWKMGLPIHHFIAATNINKVVPDYIDTGIYTPRPAIRTISNAMDIGNPSNFARMTDLLGSTWNNFKEVITGYSYRDEETKTAMRQVNEKYGYTIDPHGAVGYQALKQYLSDHPGKQGIVLETAHPAKFLEDTEDILRTRIEIPERLSQLKNLQKVSVEMENQFTPFKSWLLQHFKT